LEGLRQRRLPAQSGPSVALEAMPTHAPLRAAASIALFRCLSACKRSFCDDLVGLCQQQWRHSEAERLGGLQVDRQLKFIRQLDRQVAGFRALQDAVYLAGGTDKDVEDAGAIAHQSAHLGEFGAAADRRQAVGKGEDPRRDRDQERSVVDDKRIRLGAEH
jgi:hypothetical protein